MRNPQLEGIVGLTSWIWLSELVCVSYREFGALGMYAMYRDVWYGTECIRPRLGLIEMGLPFVAISIHFPLAIYSRSVHPTTDSVISPLGSYRPYMHRPHPKLPKLRSLRYHVLALQAWKRRPPTPQICRSLHMMPPLRSRRPSGSPPFGSRSDYQLTLSCARFEGDARKKKESLGQDRARLGRFLE